jgi:hypothetical protein
MTSPRSVSRSGLRRQGQGLRFTKDREARAVALQRTPIRKCSFFTHLDRDVRNIIYSHINFPPFPHAKQCTGLYFSCRQGKTEVEEEAIHKFRILMTAWKKWNAWTKPIIGPVQCSPLDSYRAIQNITISGLPRCSPHLLPVLASMRLSFLHIDIRRKVNEIPAPATLNSLLRNIIRHISIDWRAPGLLTFGVKKLLVSVVPTDLDQEYEDIFCGLKTDFATYGLAFAITGTWRWPSYYRFESDNHLMIVHVLQSYDLRRRITPTAWQWLEVVTSANNTVLQPARMWMATLEWGTLEIADGEEIAS